MSELDGWLAAQATQRAELGLARTLRPRGLRLDGAGGDVPVGPVDLASNDYLGLSTDPRLVEAAVAATRAWGTGSTGSRLVTGTTELHVELEEALARLTGQESALVFSSGYLANLGVVTGLAGPGTLVVSDAHVHASLVDACRLSRSPVTVVPHNDVEAVEATLRDRSEPRALVLTESVFSVLGDPAPLTDLAAVCQSHGAVLVVDEAHGLGVTGEGRGSVAAAGLSGADHVVMTATLSKALGSQGGAALGSKRLTEHLVNKARSFIFDTALAPAPAAAALAAVGVVADRSELTAQVGRVASTLAAACGVEPVAGAVLSVPVAGPRAAVEAAAYCAERGVRVGSFRPPSVPDGVSRLRMTASAKLGAPAAQDLLDRACTVVADALAAVS
ncbi:MAG TPA: 8-amino-7-oxononanoate synthase [Nocardioidaceae bacterium]|nr:8-amino-7-oxononanoate synthase [Nocardioidaceae bacterium]